MVAEPKPISFDQIAFEPPGRAARRDALPEYTNYTDTGCDIHPSCLTCPLVRCRYDEPGGARRIFSEARDGAISRLRQEGRVPIEDLARQFGVSRRTIFRVLGRERAQPLNAGN